MNFKSLSIRTDWKGAFNGTIEFDNDQSKIELKLSAEQCKQFLKICADQLVEASREVAQNLTANIIDATREVELIGKD